MHRAATAFLIAALLPAPAPAASLAQLDWQGQGKVDWASGYVISYGTGKGVAKSADRNRLRRESLKAAFREATRNLYRLCLDLRVEHSSVLRNYFQADPELQEAFRRRIQEYAPWEVRLASDGEVRVALRVPLGGAGGLLEFLVEQGVSFESGEGQPSAVPLLPEGEGRGKVSGLVLILASGEASPALRPRIRSREGAILLDHVVAGEEVRARPAFLAYYGTVEEALRDPLVGSDPLVAAAVSSPGSVTDIVLPEVLEGSLLSTAEGRSLLREARVAVVIR